MQAAECRPYDAVDAVAVLYYTGNVRSLPHIYEKFRYAQVLRIVVIAALLAEMKRFELLHAVTRLLP